MPGRADPSAGKIWGAREAGKGFVSAQEARHSWRNHWSWVEGMGSSFLDTFIPLAVLEGHLGEAGHQVVENML